MVELLTTYSIAELVGIIIALGLAIKGLIDFSDWAYARAKKFFTKDVEEKEVQQSFSERLGEEKKAINLLQENQNLIQQEIKEMREILHLLMKSDMDDIKSYITEKHHYFCYEQKWIDDYSLECLEKRYGHYIQEGGNSFIAGFMQDLRNLPKRRPN